MLNVKATTKKKEGKLVAIASTETEDRSGEVVKMGGWELDNFKANPVLQFAHRYDTPPIGIAKNIRVEDGKLVFEPMFHEITEAAREIKKMFEADPPIMRAWSVGFIPKDYDPKNDRVITKQELLEISAVPVPANAEALTLQKGISDDKKKEVCKWVDGHIQCSIEEKGAIPYSVHGDGAKAPEDDDWNAGEEVKKATGDGDKLKKMHAWVDSEAEGFDEDERKWYKLPHHRGSGSQAVVWKGVAAAMGALLGARGGVDLPSKDRKGVYDHLKKHYKQFDKDAPEFKQYTCNELNNMIDKGIIMIEEEKFDESEMFIDLKPYENEHSCRLQSPDKYKKFARKNCYAKSDGKCIDFIFGIKEDGKSEVQSMRYNKDEWTEAEAKKHCDEHGGTFEAAKKEKKQDKSLSEIFELKLGFPNKDDRKEMIKKWAGEMNEEEMKDIIKETEGFSGAYLRELVDFAKMIAEDEGIEMSEAMRKSLEKIKKQRESIDSLKKEEIEEKIKSLQEEMAELKEGRVLSQKNRELVKNIMSLTKQLASALQTLLDAGSTRDDLIDDASKDTASGGEGKPKSKVAEVAQTITKDEKMAVRALQKTSGEISQILNKIKKNRKWTKKT